MERYGHTIQFDSIKHQYHVDGKPVVSVSQLVERAMPRKTKRIDPDILAKAAQKGQALQAMIKDYELHGMKIAHHEMQSYLTLKRQHQFDVKSLDHTVLLKHHGVVIAAGTFDLLVRSPHQPGLGIVQIKRMRHLDLPRLRLQMNLYKHAYEQSTKQKVHYLKCIHIRGHEAQYLDIPNDPNCAKACLDDYFDKHLQNRTDLWFD